jgi:hypothetical protein
VAGADAVDAIRQKGHTLIAQAEAHPTLSAGLDHDDHGR